MTELEKAASGLLYDANSDPALLEARAQTSDLCMDYNALRSSQKEEKNALLHTILGACAPDIVIEPPFFVDYGSHTRVGRAFYANHNLVILDAARSPSATMCSSARTAVSRPQAIRSMLHSATPDWNMPSRVTIGNNVWIGMGVQICPASPSVITPSSPQAAL